MRPTLSLTFLFFVTGAACAEDAFEVRLDRPLKKGTRLAIEARLEHVLDGSMMGNPSTSTIRIELKGTIEILEVDAKGRLAKATCKVETCSTAKDGGAAEETLPQGHVIGLEAKNGRLEVALGKDGLDKHVAELLVRFSPWEGLDDALSDDAVFGTADRKKEGDAWDLDGRKLVARLQVSRKEVMDAARVKASAKVAGVSEVNGVKCVDVEVSVTIPDISSKGHLAGFELKESGLTWTLRKSVAQMDGPAAIALTDTLDAHQLLKNDADMAVEFKEKTTRTIRVTVAR